jgi:uncharacterized protein YndB with AHSA1/START domain
MADAVGSLVVKKQIDASVEDVFDAWTSPESLMEFMKPGGTVQRVEAQVDPRVGGKYRIDMIGTAETFSHTGEYLKIDRPRVLSFTWVSKFTDNRPSVVTIELKPLGANRCEIVLTHTGLPQNEVPGHTAGWTAILDTQAQMRVRTR